MLFLILLTSTSLLTQAFFFRDLENSESSRDAVLLEHYRGAALSGAASDRSPVESDSSRSAESQEER